ncbi:unnamed protein product, partial [Trichogramma brassicae]
MSYGAELWGWNERKELEKVQMDYVRWVLRLDFCTPGYIIVRETGRRKMHNDWIRRAVIFERKCADAEEGRLIKKVWEQQAEKEYQRKKRGTRKTRTELQVYIEVATRQGRKVEEEIETRLVDIMRQETEKESERRQVQQGLRVPGLTDSSRISDRMRNTRARAACIQRIRWAGWPAGQEGLRQRCTNLEDNSQQVSSCKSDCLIMPIAFIQVARETLTWQSRKSLYMARICYAQDTQSANMLLSTIAILACMDLLTTADGQRSRYFASANPEAMMKSDMAAIPRNYDRTSTRQPSIIVAYDCNEYALEMKLNSFGARIFFCSRYLIVNREGVYREEREAALQIRVLRTIAVQGVGGQTATLPCDIQPQESNDSVTMVLWFKDSTREPVYSNPCIAVLHDCCGVCYTTFARGDSYADPYVRACVCAAESAATARRYIRAYSAAECKRRRVSLCAGRCENRKAARFICIFSSSSISSGAAAAVQNGKAKENNMTREWKAAAVRAPSQIYTQRAVEMQLYSGSSSSSSSSGGRGKKAICGVQCEMKRKAEKKCVARLRCCSAGRALNHNCARRCSITIARIECLVFQYVNATPLRTREKT